MYRILILTAFVLFAALPAVAETKETEAAGPQPCGGFPGFECPNTHWCDYPESATCGVGDFFGTCRPKPGPNCITPQVLVCGCDGKTYPTPCAAQRGKPDKPGVDIAYLGGCRE